MLKYLFGLILSFSYLQAIDFSNQFNQYEGGEIRYFHILAERCTGSKFTKKLVEDNFSNLLHSEKFGHKHFIPWIDVPENKSVYSFCLTKEQSRQYFENSSDHLFIFIVREPFDWIRSFFQNPYHVSDPLKRTFFEFLSKEWALASGEDFYVDNYNPWEQRPFKNVLELRKNKHLNYLNVRNHVKNFLLVRYEDVCDDQEGFINFISEFFCIPRNETFTLEDKYVSHGTIEGSFVKKKYFLPSHRCVQYINFFNDWEMEKLFGYYPQSLEQLKSR